MLRRTVGHFSIENVYTGAKKFKIFNIFGIKFKFRVKFIKNKRQYIIDNRPHPLDYPVGQPRESVYSSVVAIFKDEPDIVEWIEYHKLIGIQRFYLYDNNSEKDWYGVLKPYIDSGLVVYQKVPGKAMQHPVYQDAIYRYKNETTWMAIIDLDEYIVPVEKNNINDFLKDYEKYPALIVNWVMFDSNGLEKRQSGKLIPEMFTRTYKDSQAYMNLTVKSIFNPRKVRFAPSAHVCIYKAHELPVTENFEEQKETVYFKTKYNSVNKIRINHYYCKSKEDYISKIKKGSAINGGKLYANNALLNFSDTKHDYVIQKYIEPLKEAMKDKTTLPQ
ncbi:glycosyltransferase family 92 protein [bacterium]|nr:glycosyltransferase family 92 protein [bacterium]